MHYITDALECSKPHDAFYAFRDLLEWDPHFDTPAVDYTKSSIQLAIELLPHMGKKGVQFSSNVEELLELLSFDPNTDERNYGGDAELPGNVNEYPHFTAAADPTQKSGHDCACTSSSPSRTAVWICHELSYNMKYRDHISPWWGRLEQTPDNGLEILAEWSPESNRWFLDFLQRKRPDDCLSIIGVNEENNTRTVIGLITSQAKPGDFLISSPEEAPLCHLVLRRTFDEVYQIIGYAIVDEAAHFPYKPDEEVASAMNIGCWESESLCPVLGFDFWFDAQDVLAHVLAVKDITAHRGLNSSILSLVSRSFTRTKFSSFATVCFDAELQDESTYCPECAIGYTRRICVHCGGSLGSLGSPYFKQDPVER